MKKNNLKLVPGNLTILDCVLSQVLLKGPAVTKGYYKEPQKTAELFDQVGDTKTKLQYSLFNSDKTFYIHIIVSLRPKSKLHSSHEAPGRLHAHGQH